MNLKSKPVLILAMIAALGLVLFVLFLLKSDDSGQRMTGDSQGPDAEARPWYEDFFGDGDADDEAFTDDQELSPATVLYASASEYRERAKFPPYSHPITKTNDPVKNDFKSEPARIAHPEHADGPFLVHYLNKNSYDPSDTMLVHAYLADGTGTKLKADIVARVLQGGASGRVLANIPMRDNGLEGDKANDLVYTAAFRLPAAMQREDVPPTNFTVVLTATTPIGEIQGNNAFNVGRLNIRHTGRFTDRVDTDAKGAHLLIEAEMQVERAGIFHVQGSLYGEGDTPIGWAQARVNLQPGVQNVPLKFYGKTICDAGLDGPYVLKYFAYANVAKMPGPRSDPLDNVHTTRAYRAGEFTCTGFDDPELLEKAKILEAEAAVEPK